MAQDMQASQTDTSSFIENSTEAGILLGMPAIRTRFLWILPMGISAHMHTAQPLPSSSQHYAQ